MSHWLMTYVVMKAENAAVWSLTTGVVATLVLAPFRSVVAAIWRAIKSLDPARDYGVTKQLDELQRKAADDAPVAAHRR